MRISYLSQVRAAFGPDYFDASVASAQRSYNGISYGVFCREDRTSSYTTPDSKWFAADTAITSIIAFVLTGGWGWVGMVGSIVASVVAVTIYNGVSYTIRNFTAQRSNVNITRTRYVTVSGYPGFQYWAAWTKKYYFFKGDLGWAHDIGPNYDMKHYDFENPILLIDKGFQNFVDFVLN